MGPGRDSEALTFGRRNSRIFFRGFHNQNDSDRQTEQKNRDAVLVGNVENVENGGNDRRKDFTG